MPAIKFHLNPPEDHLVQRIVDRAAREKLVTNRIDDPTKDRLSLTMDLSATHLNGNPIDFERLLHAPKDSFWHDIIGIRNSINRTTGKLEDVFSPRTSMPSCPTCTIESDVHIAEGGDKYECHFCGTQFERCNPMKDDRCEIQPDARPAQQIYDDLKPGPGKD